MALPRRVWLTVALSAALCAVLIAEVWGAQGGVLRLPLRMGGADGFPAPFLYGLGVAMYAAWYGTLFQLPRREVWARAIRLGFCLHLLALLAQLFAAVVQHPPDSLSIWYLRYLDALWVTVVAAGFVLAWRWTTAWRLARTADPHLFFLPLLIGYAAFWVSSLRLAPGLAIAASVVGLCAGAASRLPLGRIAVTRLRDFVRHERAFLLLTFCLALGLRLFYTTRVMSNPNYWETGSDGPAYDALALSLLHGGETSWSHIPLFAPGYVRFLALVYWLLGRNYFAVCAVQSAIGASACLLMYAVAKRLFGLPTARLSALFGAVNFSMVFAAAAIGHQALDLFWTLAVVWCLVRYAEDPARWGRWLFVVGMLLGWAAVTREGNIAFWLLLLGWFALGARAALGWRKAIPHALALSLGCVVVLAPFVAGKGGGISGRLGAQWFIMNYSGVDLHAWWNPWTDPGAAWARVMEQPLEVVRRVGGEILQGFNAIFLNQGYGGFDVVALVRGSAYFYAIWGYAYLLAFWGLWLVVRDALRWPIQRLGWWLLVVVLVSRALPHLLFEGSFRHRVPMEPFLIILAAYGAIRLLQRPSAPQSFLLTR